VLIWAEEACSQNRVNRFRGGGILNRLEELCKE
jgi:hypothetical protein